MPEQPLNPFEQLIRGTGEPIKGLPPSGDTNIPEIGLTLGKFNTYLSNTFKQLNDRIHNLFRIQSQTLNQHEANVKKVLTKAQVKINKVTKVIENVSKTVVNNTKSLEDWSDDVEEKITEADDKAAKEVSEFDTKDSFIVVAAIETINLSIKVIQTAYSGITSMNVWIKKHGGAISSLMGFLASKSRVYKTLDSVMKKTGDGISKFLDKTLGNMIGYFTGLPGLYLYQGLKFIGSIGWKIFEWIAKVGFFAIDFMWKTFKGLANIGWAAISGIFSGIASITKAAGTFLMDVLIDVLANPIVLAALIGVATWWFNDPKNQNSIFSKFADVFWTVFDSFVGPIKTAFDFTKKGVIAVLGWGKDKIDYITDSIKGWWDKIITDEWTKNEFFVEFKKIVGTSYDWISGVISTFIPEVEKFVNFIKNDILGKFDFGAVKSTILESFEFIELLYNAFKHGTGYKVERARKEAAAVSQRVYDDRTAMLHERLVEDKMLDMILLKYKNKITVDNKPQAEKDLNLLLNSYMNGLDIKNETLMSEIRFEARKFINTILESPMSDSELRKRRLDISNEAQEIRKEITEIRRIRADLSKDVLTEEQIINNRKRLVSIITSHQSNINKAQTNFEYVSGEYLNKIIDANNGQITGNIMDVHRTLNEQSTKLGQHSNKISQYQKYLLGQYIKFLETPDLDKKQFHLYQIISTIRSNGGTIPDNISKLYNNINNKTSIPTMATGGLVKDATLAIIGEGTDPEIVIPINKDGISFVYKSMIDKFEEYEEESEKDVPVINNIRHNIDMKTDDTLFDLCNIARGLVVLG